MTQYEELMQEALIARESAYSPYSGIKVGSAILFEDGEIITGCNVENASYGLTICAERNAMTTAIGLGLSNPVAIAIASRDGLPCTPCGACRQFLIEFNPEMDVVLQEEKNLSVIKLSELLPGYFSLTDKQ
ncbi:MAG: cytidine deaminase [Synergistaceae bacterium]